MKRPTKQEVQQTIYRAIADAAIAGKRAPTMVELRGISGCCANTVRDAILALEAAGELTRVGSPQFRTYFITSLGLETAKSAWHRELRVSLTAPAQAVLAMITEAAAIGGVSPSRDAFREMLKRQGMPWVTSTGLSDALRGLERAKLITYSGRQGGRIYRIVATGQCTVARPAHVKVPRASPTPRLPAEVSSYDLNLRRGPPVRISGPSDAQRVFRCMTQSAALVSLTGCSAAEACS